MQLHYWWWIVALALGIAELATGTFYLLVLALAGGAGGLVALSGASLNAQLLVAAAVAAVGTVMVRRFIGRGRPKQGPPESNPDILLDIGSRIQIPSWRTPSATSASYRGAQWSVELAAEEQGEPAEPGEYVIRRVVGSRLIVGRERGGQA
ncbi:MAG: NfeD family protein [Burkholderiaceae bacterium]|nr:NfeD family protein [Burkholderiaceae bacterium]